jgi:hypothetical protein
VLKELLTGCSVPKKDVSELAKEIIAIAAEAGLDTAMFGGKHCKSGRPGHLLAGSLSCAAGAHLLQSIRIYASAVRTLVRLLGRSSQLQAAATVCVLTVET